MKIHKRLKAAFDPAGILNPGPHVRLLLASACTPSTTRRVPARSSSTCLLEELGVPFDLKVDVEAEHHGPEYRKVNPKGKVPALVTPEGVLTECVAILEYLCDQHGDGKPARQARELGAGAHTRARGARSPRRSIRSSTASSTRTISRRRSEVQAGVKARGDREAARLVPRPGRAAFAGSYWSGESAGCVGLLLHGDSALGPLAHAAGQRDAEHPAVLRAHDRAPVGDAGDAARRASRPFGTA